jgi:hypothetical protein
LFEGLGLKDTEHEIEVLYAEAKITGSKRNSKVAPAPGMKVAPAPGLRVAPAPPPPPPAPEGAVLEGTGINEIVCAARPVFSSVFAVATSPPSPITDHGFSIIKTPAASSGLGQNASVVNTPTTSLQDRESNSTTVVGDRASVTGGIGNDHFPAVTFSDIAVVPTPTASSNGPRSDEKSTSLGELSREDLREEIRTMFGYALLGVVRQLGTALERPA